MKLVKLLLFLNNTTQVGLPQQWPFNIYMAHSISFQTLFVQAFKFVVDS